MAECLKFVNELNRLFRTGPNGYAAAMNEQIKLTDGPRWRRWPVRVFAASAMFALAACETPGRDYPGDAMQERDQAGEARSFDAPSILRIADNLRDRGDHMAALHMYRRVRERDPENIRALLGEAEVFMTLGAIEQAEQRFRAARSILDENDGDDDQLNARVTVGLARALLRQNRPEEAVTYFDDALQQGAATSGLYNHYGVTLDLLGRHEDAQIAYGQGLDLEPDDLELTNNLALSFALSEDYAPAIRILGDMTANRPDADGPRQNLGLVYGMSGDMDAAERVSAIDLDGSALEARLDYIARVAAMEPGARGSVIILGDEPPEIQPVVGGDEATTPAQDDPRPAAVTESGSRPETAPEPEVAPSQPDPEQAADIPLSAEPHYMVQLGAYLDAARARSGWRNLLGRNPDVLDGHEPAFRTVQVENDEGVPETIIRMGIHVADGFRAATTLCESLTKEGVDCMVRRVPAPPGDTPPAQQPHDEQ